LKEEKNMPGISFRKIVSFCELLNSNLKTHLADMPHLQEESAGLDALVTQAKSLDNEQQLLRGRLSEITRLRREAELQGRDLRSRVVAQLQGKLGFKNENLLGFGIPPRKRGRKKQGDLKPVPGDPLSPAKVAEQQPAASPGAGSVGIQ
jgi:hypothetical protein